MICLLFLGFLEYGILRGQSGHFVMLETKIRQEMQELYHFETPKDFEHPIWSIFQGAKKVFFWQNQVLPMAPGDGPRWSWVALSKKLQIHDIQLQKWCQISCFGSVLKWTDRQTLQSASCHGQAVISCHGLGVISCQIGRNSGLTTDGQTDRQSTSAGVELHLRSYKIKCEKNMTYFFLKLDHYWCCCPLKMSNTCKNAKNQKKKDFSVSPRFLVF